MADGFEEDDFANDSQAVQKTAPPNAETASEQGMPDRRDFLKNTVRRAAYVAPIVMLFKPREAVAGSGGSAITPGP